MDKLAERLGKRQARMQNVRNDYEPLLKEASKYVHTRRYDWTGSNRKGLKRATEMYDGTAQEAFLAWVDGILAYVVSQELVWFKCGIRDRPLPFGAMRRLSSSDRVQTWLQDYAEQMYWEYRNSNYYGVLPEFLRDGAGSGTASLYTEEASDYARVFHKVPHPCSVYVMQNAEGKVDVWHEIVTLTAREAYQQFGQAGDTLSQTCRDYANDAAKSDVEFHFLHAICPKDDPAIFPDGPVTKKKWASVYVELTYRDNEQVALSNMQGFGTTVRKGGYDYFPATVWRFGKNSDEVYGYSPAMDIMSTILLSQQIGKDLIHMGHVASKGIWNVPEEQRAAHSILPGGRNFYTATDRKVERLQNVTGEYPIAKDREDVIKELIRHRYGYPFWYAMSMLTQKKERVYATQVMELQAERGMMLVPQVGNLCSEGLQRTFDNVAYLANKGRRLPPPPPELQDLAGADEIHPKFTGPLVRIQEMMFRLAPLKQGLQLVAGLAQAIQRPDILDKINGDELLEYVWNAVDAPERLLYPDEVVAARRQRRAQLQMAQMKAELTKRYADAAAKGGKAVEPTSVMAKLIGVG